MQCTGLRLRLVSLFMCFFFLFVGHLEHCFSSFLYNELAACRGYVGSTVQVANAMSLSKSHVRAPTGVVFPPLGVLTARSATSVTLSSAFPFSSDGIFDVSFLPTTATISPRRPMSGALIRGEPKPANQLVAGESGTGCQFCKPHSSHLVYGGF